MTPPIDKHDAQRRGRGDRGAALVEFALVAVLLFTLIFGITNFGFMLNFKQDLTRAAAEGARAGAVAVTGDAVADAQAATEEAVRGFGKECGEEGMECLISPATFDCDAGGPGDAQCVEVTLRYNYKDFPLLPEFPIVSELTPDTLSASSVARVNT